MTNPPLNITQSSTKHSEKYNESKTPRDNTEYSITARNRISLRSLRPQSALTTKVTDTPYRQCVGHKEGIHKVPLWEAVAWKNERSALDDEKITLFSSFSKDGVFNDCRLGKGYTGFVPLWKRKNQEERRKGRTIYRGAKLNKVRKSVENQSFAEKQSEKSVKSNRGNNSFDLYRSDTYQQESDIQPQLNSGRRRSVKPIQKTVSELESDRDIAGWSTYSKSNKLTSKPPLKRPFSASISSSRKRPQSAKSGRRPQSANASTISARQSTLRSSGRTHHGTMKDNRQARESFLNLFPTEVEVKSHLEYSKMNKNQTDQLLEKKPVFNRPLSASVLHRSENSIYLRKRPLSASATKRHSNSTVISTGFTPRGIM